MFPYVPDIFADLDHSIKHFPVCLCSANRIIEDHFPRSESWPTFVGSLRIVPGDEGNTIDEEFAEITESFSIKRVSSTVLIEAELRPIVTEGVCIWFVGKRFLVGY